MKHGADWYKRDPAAYLGGVQGLTAREHAVYSVILDLIYAYGGSVNNDPRWIAGWISDMGAAAIRATIQSLAARGKLIVTETEIRQKRAENEVKTRENLRENRQKAGKKGGKNSAKSRAELKENNEIGQANASTFAQPIREEKRREEYGGGGSAREREAENHEISTDPPTFRESVLSAIGVDPVSGLTGPGGRMLGTQADMAELGRWRQMGLSMPEILGVIGEVMAGKPDGPPSRFSYFTGAMGRLAAAKAAPLPEPEAIPSTFRGLGAVFPKIRAQLPHERAGS